MNYKEMADSYGFHGIHMKSLEAENKLKLLWGMMRVEEWKSIMEQNTMTTKLKDDDKIEIQLKV